MNCFSTRLRELREERNLTQREFAAILNVDQRTISNWEKSVREPNFDMLINIAKVFDIQTDYLLGLID